MWEKLKVRVLNISKQDRYSQFESSQKNRTANSPRVTISYSSSPSDQLQNRSRNTGIWAETWTLFFLKTCIGLFTYTSLFGVAGLLASSSGACHFFLPGSSLWLALADVLAYKSPKLQSFAVQILLTNTLRALMLQWRRSLLWRKSYRERSKKGQKISILLKTEQKISHDTIIDVIFVPTSAYIGKYQNAWIWHWEKWW